MVLPDGDERRERRSENERSRRVFQREPQRDRGAERFAEERDAREVDVVPLADVGERRARVTRQTVL